MPPIPRGIVDAPGRGPVRVPRGAGVTPEHKLSIAKLRHAQITATFPTDEQHEALLTAQREAADMQRQKAKDYIADLEEEISELETQVNGTSE